MQAVSETQTMLAKSIDQVLAKHWSVHSLCEGRPKPDLWPLLVDLGLPSAELPADWGGLDLPFADLAPVFQRIGQALATTYLNEFMVMGGWLVAASETPPARHLASRIASGEARVAVAFGEHGDGGDLCFTRTRAIQAGGDWQIEGSKAVVVGGDRATHLTFPALIDADAGDPSELGLFLVSTESAGLISHAIPLYDGSVAADFEFRRMMIPGDSLLARGSKAVDLVELALDRGRAALCHEAVGLLEKVTGITLDYVKTRNQFGQPIGTFQTMQHRMADMRMDLELAHSCAELATAAISSGSDTNKRMRTISAAMATMCDCARRVGQSAVQAHGAIALTQDYIVGHYFKRLTMVERYLGNAEFHVDRYLARGGPQATS